MHGSLRLPIRWTHRVLLAFALILPAAVGTSRVSANDSVAQVVDDRCSDPAVANGKMAVLDPGHHADQPGAVNQRYGLVEADLNLDIAERTRRVLNGRGFRVCLTRTKNVDLRMGNSDRGDYANAVTQGYPTSKTVFVSIHLNASSTERVNYTKTFWGKRNKDLEFARAIHNALWDALKNDGNNQPTNLTDGGVGQFATGSLLQAAMPATLAENVFLSNNAEAARLADACGDTGTCRRQQIASRLAFGVHEWLRQR